MLLNYFSDKNNLIIAEKEIEIMYNSIARIEIMIGVHHEYGTGFFMRIPNDNERLYFFVTNYHVINENKINQDIKVNIYFGKKNSETKRVIDLNTNKRLIIFFKDKEVDVTVIQILRSDNILDYKFLIPDLKYKNRYDFYINKPCYLAGYPNINGLEEGLDRCISPGIITKIQQSKSNIFDFAHEMKTKFGSSGSPICLKNNLNLIGIHKSKKKDGTINYGTFIGEVIDEITKEENINKVKINN